MSDTLEFLLRSLRDLEAEHDAGDIDEADYVALKEDYTARAAAMLRDASPAADPPSPTDPLDEADHAGSREASPDTEPETEVPAEPPGRRPRRRWLRPVAVGTGALILAGGIAWGVTAATSNRSPGETITGAQPNQSDIAKLLDGAARATANGDPVTALKDYRQVLQADPQQVQALTGEGWLLAQTQQQALVNRGLALLQAAEQVAPTYAPAHLFRGVTLQLEGDDRTAIQELQYYLAHGPDPSLTAKVQQALVQAEADLAKQTATSTTAPPH